MVPWLSRNGGSVLRPSAFLSLPPLSLVGSNVLCLIYAENCNCSQFLMMHRRQPFSLQSAVDGGLCLAVPSAGNGVAPKMTDCDSKHAQSAWKYNGRTKILYHVGANSCLVRARHYSILRFFGIPSTREATIRVPLSRVGSKLSLPSLLTTALMVQL